MQRHCRYEINAHFQLVPIDGTRDGILGGRSVDISERGIAGIFAGDLGVGAHYEAEFDAPGSAEPIRVGVILRNWNGCRGGFEFVNLNQLQRQVIKNACAVLASREYEFLPEVWGDPD